MAVFALVGISVLETMLVLFIMDMEAHCSKKFSKPVKVDKQLDEHGQYAMAGLSEPSHKVRGHTATRLQTKEL